MRPREKGKIGWQKNSDGTAPKTVTNASVVRTRWTFYDAKGKIINPSKTETTRLCENQTVGSIMLTVGPALANAGTAIRELAGAQYARRCPPRDTTLRREYHANGDLAAGADRRQQHDWLGGSQPVGGPRSHGQPGQSSALGRLPPGKSAGRPVQSTGSGSAGTPANRQTASPAHGRRRGKPKLNPPRSIANQWPKSIPARPAAHTTLKAKRKDWAKPLFLPAWKRLRLPCLSRSTRGPSLYSLPSAY